MTTRPLLTWEISALEQLLARKGRQRDRLFVLLAVSTGYRVTELLTLRIGQLVAPDGQVVREISVARQDLKNGRSKYRKSVRTRRVVLNERARLAIEDYLASLPVHPPSDTFVFRSRQGGNQPIRRCQALCLLKTAAMEAGLDAARIGCHSARKSMARAVHAAGGNDLVKTQRILGHASPVTTARYLETTDAELDALVMGFDPLAPASGEPPTASNMLCAVRTA